MVKLLFVLMNEYRLWAMPQALATLEERYPGASEGQVYSIREVNASAELEQRLLDAAGQADMAFLASHGSIQNLHCFPRLWKALTGRPVYFTSTLGDELAEIRRSTPLWTPTIRRGARRIWKGWCCVRSITALAGTTLFHPPVRSGGRGSIRWRAFCRRRPRGPFRRGWPRSPGR